MNDAVAVQFYECAPCQVTGAVPLGAGGACWNCGRPVPLGPRRTLFRTPYGMRTSMKWVDLRAALAGPVV
ncbi:MAG: hypothetical protein ACOYY2_12980 [Actinomycetota bacterium]